MFNVHKRIPVWNTNTIGTTSDSQLLVGYELRSRRFYLADTEKHIDAC